VTQTKPIIAIVNVVASATIEQKLDLVDITKKFPAVEYHPEQFPSKDCHIALWFWKDGMYRR
jgi:transcription initiation factor TFIID TATA-box-binding protein